MVATTTERNNLCTRYAADCLYMGVYSTAPGASAGTELNGGTPPYARNASNWGTPAGGQVVATPAAHNIPSGATTAGVGFHTAATAGTYLDGTTIPSMTFSSQGTLAATATFTEN